MTKFHRNRVCRSRTSFTPLEMRSIPVLWKNRNTSIGHGEPLFRTGFTLVEVLIVVAISAMLASIAISYSGISRNEVSVSMERAKISQFLFQARTLAVATYMNSSSSCGFGVFFDYNAGTYSLFAYNHPLGVSSCLSSAAVEQGGFSSDLMAEYTSSTWNIPVANGVHMDGQPGNSIGFVLFYPPEPTVFLSQDRTSFTSASPLSVYLEPVGDVSAVQTISINSVGEITL